MDRRFTQNSWFAAGDEEPLKALLQRVSRASVDVDEVCVGEIGKGLLVFLGIEKGDAVDQADSLARKVAEYRVFEDSEGKMNCSLEEVQGQILVISQFTLCADTKKGRRPSFDPAAPPRQAEPLYLRFVENLRARGLKVATGRFGASMRVNLCNEGPVTFLMEQENSAGLSS